MRLWRGMGEDSFDDELSRARDMREMASLRSLPRTTNFAISES